MMKQRLDVKVTDFQPINRFLKSSPDGLVLFSFSILFCYCLTWKLLNVGPLSVMVTVALMVGMSS